MVLSDVDIRNRINSGEAMVQPFIEENLQGASYDLTVSNKVTVFKKSIKTIDLADQNSIDEVYEKKVLTASGYVLEPNEYVLIPITEKITVPTCMTAHIRPRTRFTRLGIIVEAQNCNPGYSGVLQLGVYNASPNAVIIKPNLRIAQVVFEELTSEPSANKQYQNKPDSAYMNEQGTRGSVVDRNELSPNAKKVYDLLSKAMFGTSER